MGQNLLDRTCITSNSCLPFLQGNRDENQNVNHQMAQEDAQRLYQAGEGRLGTDESCFNMILAIRSFPQLKATMEAYSRVRALFEDLTSVSRCENILTLILFVCRWLIEIC